ncbi:MAG: hypothetical protein CM15mP103_05060 [Gammaproteobacteria bacterium]|nr:MAG: hypothetical protein CM15mP103_05060 [Gammaproteobacteria bacterium]
MSRNLNETAAMGNGLPKVVPGSPAALPTAGVLRANQHRADFRLGQLPPQMQQFSGRRRVVCAQRASTKPLGSLIQKGRALIPKGPCRYPPRPVFGGHPIEGKIQAPPNFRSTHDMGGLDNKWRTHRDPIATQRPDDQTVFPCCLGQN